MDFFNTAFSPNCASLPFVPNGLIEGKVCPMDSFNTAFALASPSHHFCPYGTN